MPKRGGEGCRQVRHDIVSLGQGEYDSYVLAIYRLLITRRPKYAIFDYLWALVTQHMGLTGSRQVTDRFAERLLRTPQEIDEGHETSEAESF
jgi:hypothetical protein